MAKRKIKKGPIPESGRIHKKYSLQDDYLRFSFKYLDVNDKFHFREKEFKYFLTLLERLKSISGLNVQSFRGECGKSLRAHTIKWEETTEKNGFKNLNPQLRQCEPWQFQLTSNEHGRVHGLLIDEVFYVVWLEPVQSLLNRWYYSHLSPCGRGRRA